MNTNLNFNPKQIYIEQMNIYHYINLKVKVKILESHHRLPIFSFVDEENNIYVYLINEKQLLRGFNMQNINPDDYKVKNIAFVYSENSKNQYENNFQGENLKSKLPYLLRDYLLMIVVEKSILFYNLFTRNIYCSITSENLEKKYPSKIEAIDDNYLIILTTDGKLLT